MPAPWQEILNKIDDYRWEIPQSYKKGMAVPGLIFTSESMLNHIWEEQVFQQVANVAFLPGIVSYSGGSYSTYREAVAPVNIRHSQ